jgi:hypothetical protein
LASIAVTFQVFDHDRAMFTGQPGSQFVQAVAAQIAHAGVGAAEPGSGALPTFRRAASGTPVRTGLA